MLAQRSVVDLREPTQAKCRCMLTEHLWPRFEDRRVDAVTADDPAHLVRELRAEGNSQATIAVSCESWIGCKSAARWLGWTGTIPSTLMLARVSR